MVTSISELNVTVTASWMQFRHYLCMALRWMASGAFRTVTTWHW